MVRPKGFKEVAFAQTAAEAALYVKCKKCIHSTRVYNSTLPKV